MEKHPLMSFMLTTQAVRDHVKTVTRRLGWNKLKPGQRFYACVKCMGLKRGEHVERICLCECVSNTKERLDAITQEDVRREGFPDWTPAQFVAFFCKHNKVKPSKRINRIKFKYV